MLDVNLRGTLYMSQAVIPAMREHRSGSIVQSQFRLCPARRRHIRRSPLFRRQGGVLGLTKAMHASSHHPMCVSTPFAGLHRNRHHSWQADAGHAGEDRGRHPMGRPGECLRCRRLRPFPCVRAFGLLHRYGSGRQRGITHPLTVYPNRRNDRLPGGGRRGAALLRFQTPLKRRRTCI